MRHATGNSSRVEYTPTRGSGRSSHQTIDPYNMSVRTVEPKTRLKPMDVMTLPYTVAFSSAQIENYKPGELELHLQGSPDWNQLQGATSKSYKLANAPHFNKNLCRFFGVSEDPSDHPYTKFIIPQVHAPGDKSIANLLNQVQIHYREANWIAVKMYHNPQSFENIFSLDSWKKRRNLAVNAFEKLERVQQEWILQLLNPPAEFLTERSQIAVANGDYEGFIILCDLEELKRNQQKLNQLQQPTLPSNAFKTETDEKEEKTAILTEEETQNIAWKAQLQAAGIPLDTPLPKAMQMMQNWMSKSSNFNTNSNNNGVFKTPMFSNFWAQNALKKEEKVSSHERPSDSLTVPFDGNNKRCMLRTAAEANGLIPISMASHAPPQAPQTGASTTTPHIWQNTGFLNDNFYTDNSIEKIDVKNVDNQVTASQGPTQKQSTQPPLAPNQPIVPGIQPNVPAAPPDQQLAQETINLINNNNLMQPNRVGMDLERSAVVTTPLLPNAQVNVRNPVDLGLNQEHLMQANQILAQHGVRIENNQLIPVPGATPAAAAVNSNSYVSLALATTFFVVSFLVFVSFL